MGSSRIFCAPLKGKFERVVMTEDFPIDSAEAAMFVEHAVVVADLSQTPVHVQNPNEITIYIAHPESE